MKKYYQISQIRLIIVCCGALLILTTLVTRFSKNGENSPSRVYHQDKHDYLWPNSLEDDIAQLEIILPASSISNLLASAREITTNPTNVIAGIVLVNDELAKVGIVEGKDGVITYTFQLVKSNWNAVARGRVDW